MQAYIETTLQFFESEEMREYLLTRPDWMDRSKCAESVSRAPAPLEIKLSALELIAKQAEHDAKKDYHDPGELAKSVRIALNERYNALPGTVFLLTLGEFEDQALFNGFDEAMRYLHEFEETENDAERKDFVWYRIDKWIPGENGRLKEYCGWTLNALGEAWYFDFAHGFEPDDWEEPYDYLGNLTLPVPFQPGDIVLADCSPFAKEKRVLIIGYDGPETDCCALQCLFTLPDGKINVGAFSHNAFLMSDSELSHVSGHYRAARYHGELSEAEKPLAVIGAAMRERPELGDDIHSCICKQTSRKAPDFRGADWDQLRNEFNL